MIYNHGDYQDKRSTKLDFINDPWKSKMLLVFI